MPDNIETLQKDAIASIASVSTLLRNAIAAALPVAPEQYLTVAIPGTVIDLAEYEKGGSFVYDVAKYATTPKTVGQSEARLVDGMMPVATIMVSMTIDILQDFSLRCKDWQYRQERCSQLFAHA